MKDGTSSLKTGAGVELDSGAGTLKTGIDTYTKGTDQLNSGIQTYLSKKGVLSGKTGEFKKGVDTLAQGIEQYTDGASTLNDGVSAYVDGVNKLSAGASQLQPLVEGLTTVKGAIQQMNAALDGKGDVTEGGYQCGGTGTGSRDTAAAGCGGCDWHGQQMQTAARRRCQTQGSSLITVSR